jgi:hypothetical protein
VTGYRLDDPGKGKYMIYSLLLNVQTVSGAHPASYSMGTEFFLEINQPEPESDDSTPSSAEVKNEWRSICAPLICLHRMDVEIFTSTFCC